MKKKKNLWTAKGCCRPPWSPQSMRVPFPAGERHLHSSLTTSRSQQRRHEVHDPIWQEIRQGMWYGREQHYLIELLNIDDVFDPIFSKIIFRRVQNTNQNQWFWLSCCSSGWYSPFSSYRCSSTALQQSPISWLQRGWALAERCVSE